MELDLGTMHGWIVKGPFVRQNALRAMISIKDLTAEDLGQIESMKNDPDYDVVRWSEIALRNIRLRDDKSNKSEDELDGDV